jgi:hypothetical protein
VNATLPPCAAAELPKLRLAEEEDLAASPHSSGSVSAAAAAYGALSLLSIGLAAAGLVSQRTRQRRLLAGSAAQAAGGLDADAFDAPARPARKPLGGLPLHGRHASLAGAVREALADSPGLAGLEMLPLPTLPHSLTHHLGSVRRRPPGSAARAGNASGSGNERAAGQQPEDCHPLLLRKPGDAAEPLMPARSALASWGRLSADRVASAGLGGNGGPPVSRQWGLASESLQVPLGQLKVRQAGSQPGRQAGRQAANWLGQMCYALWHLAARPPALNANQPLSLCRLPTDSPTHAAPLCSPCCSLL